MRARDGKGVLAVLRGTYPRTREELARWVEAVGGMKLPRAGVCGGHDTPLDYLEHVFFEREGDAVVWACRGGGKTQVAAAATLLDLVFKPGIQVRILAGSLAQAERMYGYLRKMVERGFRDLVAGEPTRRRLALVNGSAVEVLAQSESAVRGQRVQKLRCDEVELFDRAVWEAGQLVTRGMRGKGVGGEAVRGAVEAISTRHVVGGLMGELVEGAAGKKEGRKAKVFQWCVWDVVERCGEERKCAGCGLWGDCGGRARAGGGFLPIEDLLVMQGRVSRRVWETEMLCQAPRTEGAVFGGFSRERCVRERGWEELAGEDGGRWVCGMDFGFRTFVCLLMRVWKAGDGERVYVADEIVEEGRVLGENVERMKERAAGGAGGWAGVEVVYCDVAGRQHNAHSGRTDVAVLREAGYRVACRGMEVEAGLGRVEALVSPASGGASRLEVHPRCGRLIRAMESYRRDAKTGKAVKDGEHDHCVDALRYGVCGVMGGGWRVERRTY